jgi:MFS family permease
MIAIGAMALGLASLVLAASRSFPVSWLAMLVAGGAAIGMAVTANATIQAVVPDQLRGRTMAVYVSVLSSSVPLGGILIGGIASLFGVPAAFAVGGSVAVVVGAAALIRIPALLARTAASTGGPTRSSPLPATDPAPRP